MDAADVLPIDGNHSEPIHRHRRHHWKARLFVARRTGADLDLDRQRAELLFSGEPRLEELFEPVFRREIDVAAPVRDPDAGALHADFDRVVLPVVLVPGRVAEEHVQGEHHSK